MKNIKLNQKALNQLKSQYDGIEIPKELDEIAQKAVIKGLEESSKRETVISFNKSKERKNIMKKHTRNVVASLAVGVISFTAAANLSPSFAQSMSEVPIIKDLVKVVCLTQFNYNDQTYNANMDTPVIEGLENVDLQQTLNTKYLEENKKLFNQFEAEVANMKTFEEGGHLGIDSGYEVKTNNEHILSIGRYVVNTVASSSTTMTYDTIDKQNQMMITLPSLFKDDRYIEVISQNIIKQMKDKRAKDANLVYWIDGEQEAIDGFKAIKSNQQFYISDQGKLVISFDKYEIAPGFMGVQTFEIPTAALQDLLVSNVYIE